MKSVLDYFRSTYRSGLQHLGHIVDVIRESGHPYRKSALLLISYAAVFVANSLLRNRGLHGELSPEYVATLYFGGLVALIAENAFVALAFFGFFRRSIGMSFGNLYLGLIVFGCANVVVALLNLILPIVVYTTIDETTYSYSVLSAQYFLGVREQSVFIHAVLPLLDLVVLLRLSGHSFYVARSTHRRYWVALMVGLLTQLALNLGPWIVT